MTNFPLHRTQLKYESKVPVRVLLLLLFYQCCIHHHNNNIHTAVVVQGFSLPSSSSLRVVSIGGRGGGDYGRTQSLSCSNLHLHSSSSSSSSIPFYISTFSSSSSSSRPSSPPPATSTSASTSTSLQFHNAQYADDHLTSNINPNVNVNVGVGVPMQGQHAQPNSPPPIPNLPSSSDPYVLFNLPRHATAVDIKRAYRRYALMYHPDVRITVDSTAEERRRANDDFAR